MGARDYYKKGDWNAICDVCGFKRKASEMKMRWDGIMCCPEDWEPRQPQDFVRGVPDDQTVPWTRPEPPDVFVIPPLALLDTFGLPLTDTNGDYIYTTGA
jgi:hypothetical protein